MSFFTHSVQSNKQQQIFYSYNMLFPPFTARRTQPFHNTWVYQFPFAKVSVQTFEKCSFFDSVWPAGDRTNTQTNSDESNPVSDNDKKRVDDHEVHMCNKSYSYCRPAQTIDSRHLVLAPQPVLWPKKRPAAKTGKKSQYEKCGRPIGPSH